MLEEGLHWSIRRSFARYVAGLVDGRLAVDDGVKPTETGGLLFPFKNQGVSENRLSFRGVASFYGHFGMLAVRIAQPTITLDPSNAGGMLHVAGSDGSIEFATFMVVREEGDDRMLLLGRNVRLSAPAAAMFGGAYAANETLDDFLVVLSQGGRR